ncbi:MAG: cation/multidrug efflux pump [Gammaproteobacteria bacterium]|nr:cation/multidrug efflux pump [Gammaproteobacteria bacterium]
MSATLLLSVGVAAGILLALALILNGGRHLRRRRLLRGGSQGLLGLVIGLAVAVVLLVGLNLLTYARFSAEQPVGTIAFEKLAPRRYAATLTQPDGRITHATLNGNQWELDARIIKWTDFGTMLGLQPLYRLERLSGRFENIDRARYGPHSIVPLAGEPGLSLWETAHKQSGWLPLVDATYGTATYLPMADKAVYRVSLSRTGLLARPANEAARKAVNGWR